MMNSFRAMTSPLVRLFVALIFSASFSANAAADLPIYTDSLALGWSNWSWGVTNNLSNPSPVHMGTGSIAVTATSAWGALYLHPDSPVSTAGYNQLQFWVHGGTSGGQHLRLVVNGSNNYAFTPAANVWTLVSVPLSAIGYPATLIDLYWQDANGAVQPTFYIDDITLMAGSGGTPPPVVGPALTISVDADRHAISGDIYGINLLGDEALAAELRLPVRRWGGNSTTRYNWQNDTTNTGMDWYFENIPNDNPNLAALPDGSASDHFVEQDQRTGTRSLITVPTIGWVAKRRTNGHPYDCAFSVKKYGTQQSTDPWDADCGNGKMLNVNGNNITGNDPTDTSVASSPSFITGWINHLVGKYGTAANGGVAYYAFDNEPMIWHGTHRDIHPAAPTYDEMLDRTIQYGAAIKAGDPSARTLGPVEDGWCRYLYSGADNCLPGADYQAHGSVQYVPWYLQQMKSYELQHGLRILDYLDLHYYPSANGVSLSGAGSAATQALRLRSTRSLWDASYIDESWISDTQNGGVAVRMIPRMKQWVTDNYFGTKTAITEYNWGAPESMNGALAQADVLGIFGRESLDLATLWGDVLATQPLSFAFRMYRNYDGQGHGFGDTAVRSLSADQAELAVYAAQRSADGVLTIMLVNKSASPLTSTLSLTGFNPQSTAAVYQYTPANLAAIEHAADQAVSASGFTATAPASSITLFELQLAGQTNYALSVTKSGNGFGNLSSSPAGINCGAACSASFGSGASVTLSASRSTGNAFSGWSGDCSGSGDCVLAMGGARNVTANFVSAAFAPIVGFNPGVLPFAEQALGTTSAAMTVTLSNAGNAALDIANIATSGNFAINHACGASLPVAGSCTLSVTFTPGLAGLQTGLLTLTSNAIGSPHRLSLSGTGVAAPVCSLSAVPAKIRGGAASTLTATCNPVATSWAWTGGTCAGTTASTCTVTPAVTTAYGVTGKNSYGSSTATADVTVRAVDLTPILMLLLD